MMDLGDFEEAYGNPGKALSLLVRPTITAPEGKVLVWGDWSNVEARGLPWLAKAEKRLDVFRAIDADPDNTPDVYLQAAAGMYHHDPDKLLAGHKIKDLEVKALRQKGKIAELALGFAGGAGALQSMAANYGMAFGADEAKDIVARWRAANAWAERFWEEVMGAFMAAVQNPGKQVTAGRVVYEGVDVGGELWVICYLPDNRPLFYRDVRERVKTEYDPFDPKVVVSKERKLSFQSEKGTKWVWRGLLVENITQAICASLLRETLVDLDDSSWEWMPIVGHTHDEVVTLADEANASAAREHLHRTMTADRGWNKRFPLEADITVNTWYSKAIEG